MTIWQLVLILAICVPLTMVWVPLVGLLHRRELSGNCGGWSDAPTCTTVGSSVMRSSSDQGTHTWAAHRRDR